MKALLVLEDGTTYQGQAFGAPGEAAGEVVFNTSMTGYQEILTDPSYKGQIVTMTYPLIGNYGVNPEDVESAVPQVEGFVVREISRTASNYRATGTLDEYLCEHGICGITGVDTRALTRHIRLAGTMRGVISTGDDPDALLEKANSVASMLGADFVKVVTREEPAVWSESIREELELDTADVPSPAYRVVAIDYGLKANIARLLVRYGFEVTIVPADLSAAEIARFDPQCIFLSNGPGDPAAVTYAVETIREILPRYPTFGICLGHQLMGLALGAKTYKMKFGHRGANQPVQDIKTGKVAITSQNHGFAVDSSTLDTSGVEVTEINLNDRTVEGIAHKELPAFSVQYHPEASPGPHDTRHLFSRFRRLVKEAL
ncbi:MAG: glutamine-hydrolyzing carbamoyl-phosphate synthase small subunit [Planctomycetes bacterium]|nr:glutamine-hydrolyzing carbamoyl-phosphate synthase small subunit [Planctomycetota bacterium]